MLSLIFTDLACPSKFSCCDKFITDGPNLSIPVFVIFIKEWRFKKSFTDKPEENFADPEVGKTWLGPSVINLAQHENLEGHANSIKIRIKEDT